MKHLKIVALFAAIVSIEQLSYTRDYYNPPPDRLIEESYVSPAMQWALLSFFEQPFIYNKITGAPIIIDKKTNKPRDWFTIEEILNNLTLSSLSTASKITTVNALQAAIQAIDIAVEVAKLEAGYDANKQSYYFYQNADKKITEILYAKKQKLEAMLARVQSARINGTGEAFAYEVKQPDNKDFMMLSLDQVAELINAADFKTKVEHTAAQLLFKQCFMAQLHHTKSNIRLENITKAQHSDEDTIYSKFPSMSELMSIAKKMPTKPEEHALLTDIRKSVQTALYIAQKEYQKFYHLRTHPLVQALKDMDAQVKAIWIDPEHGATQDDLSRDAMWTNLTNAAIGAGAVVGVVGAAGAAYYASNNPYAVRYAVEQGKEQIGNIGTSIQNQVQETGTAVYNKAAQLAQDTGKLLERLNPLPEPSALKVAEYQAKDQFNKATGWLKSTSSQDNVDVSTPQTDAQKSFETANYF